MSSFQSKFRSTPRRKNPCSWRWSSCFQDSRSDFSYSGMLSPIPGDEDGSCAKSTTNRPPEQFSRTRTCLRTCRCATDSPTARKYLQTHSRRARSCAGRNGSTTSTSTAFGITCNGENSGFPSVTGSALSVFSSAGTAGSAAFFAADTTGRAKSRSCASSSPQTSDASRGPTDEKDRAAISFFEGKQPCVPGTGASLDAIVRAARTTAIFQF
mmetsp:Transcript_18774/g.46954  ORF Transcript_18774/g.46954 Transcript_18774/m.46954 type:complete len:212 (+) Transcript_18774:2386-3021(+)